MAKSIYTARIPYQFIDQYLRLVGADATAVFIVLVRHARWSGPSAGECWPTYNTICHLTSIRRNNIRPALDKLVAYGVITIEKRKRVNDDGVEYGNIRNCYTVTHMKEHDDHTK